jgi:predicted phage terminase large subunit-like protein
MHTKIERQFQLLAKHDYSFYLEYVHRGHYKHAKHTLYMCEKLQAVERGEIKRLMIFMPPRHSKSQTVSESFPSWFLGRNPDKRVMLVCYADTLAKTFGRKNRQKIEEFGSDIFNVGVSKDNASISMWGIEGREGIMLSQGIEASLTGHGASLICIDDPLRNREAASSKTQRDKIYEEYKSSIMTRLTPDGRVILIMTRWHEDDLAGAILANEREKWDVVSLPAFAEPGDLLGRSEGEPLWAEQGFDADWLNATKASIGNQAFASLYQQNPVADEGNIIRRPWIKYYDVLPSKFEETYISLDASFKGGVDNDYCVFTVWGIKEAEKYLIDFVREKLDFVQTVQVLRQLYARYYPNGVLIEDAANGSGIVSTLQREISGIIAVRPEGGKESRLHAVAPQFESGNVFFPSEKLRPDIFDCVQEITSMPNSRNDDFADSVSQALLYFQKRPMLNCETEITFHEKISPILRTFALLEIRQRFMVRMVHRSGYQIRI